MKRETLRKEKKRKWKGSLEGINKRLRKVEKETRIPLPKKKSEQAIKWHLVTTLVVNVR